MAIVAITTASRATQEAAIDRALASIFSAYIATATLCLLFVTAVSICLAYKFGAPDFGSGAWLMSLFVVVWAVWYAARMWDVPEQFANTPTYSNQAPTQAK